MKLFYQLLFFVDHLLRYTIQDLGIISYKMGRKPGLTGTPGTDM